MKRNFMKAVSALLAGSMLCFSFSAAALYYSQGQKIARVITDEGD